MRDVSAGALTAALVAGLPVAADAQQVLLRDVSRGADGASWYWQNSVAHDSLPGGNGGNVIRENEATSATPSASTTVELGSIGGVGALGVIYDIRGTTYYTPGKDGGSAGTVSLRQLSAISGNGSQTKDTPLILLYSQGGDGRVGGNGIGKGGAAGSVSLFLDAQASTVGDHFGGVWARSIGGQTGRNERYFEDGAGHRYGLLNGYWIAGVSPSNVSQFPGASGNKVSTEIAATGGIATNGSYAPALILESIGGAGNDGATYLNKLPGAGQGGEVSLVSRGAITTEGSTSTAVLLQSVGGRGGNQLFMLSSSNYSGDAGGGDGGIGGNGGTVDALNIGSIRTKGDYSFGLAAFSIGGAGGNGASAFGVRNGGNGGAAGNGGTVDVVNAGSIVTAGEGAIGIVAQSLGGGGAANAFQRTDITPKASGGGGAGGGSTSVFFGGSTAGVGGAGGNGGAVNVTNRGTILTTGASAYGILAQSVGGGGGGGGNAKSAFSILLGSSEGGDGGGGGNGGAVTIKRPDLLLANQTPSITTTGKASSAIVAQSIGGGGGAGGTASTTTVGAILSVSVAIGGAGGKGGDGDRVTIDNTSNITTAGVSAHGIEAHSLGGGGGKGGDASAYAAAVAPPGYPAVAVSYSVGGSGGGGGKGSTVEVTNDASIRTTGSSAYGILATSIGGGGGNGGSASSLSDMFGLYKNLAVAMSLGGSAGGGGAGGHVLVTNRRSVETNGTFADAIVATSIGGGGGIGGAGEAKTAKGASWNDDVSKLGELVPIADTFAVNLAIGGKGGEGGNGERVDVSNEGSILTRGEDSRGIFAQSIGGGGGKAGGYNAGGDGEYAVRLSLGGSGGKGGSGSVVRVLNLKGATIETQGSGSAGIFAQSVGGGGGIGGSFSGKTKSPVSLDDNASGFLVQLADEMFKLNKQGVKNYQAQTADEKKAADERKEKYTARDPQIDTVFNKKGSVQEKVAYAKDIFSVIKTAVNSAKADIARNEKIAKDRAAGKYTDDSTTPEQYSAAEIVVRSFYESGKTLALSKLYDQFADTLKDALKEAGVKGHEFKYNASVNVALGGTGGAGGAGGSVDVYNEGTILTEGTNSMGILAQSIGGGGGAGGSGLAAGSNRTNLNVSLGGTGTVGGAGGSVLVTNNHKIQTEGAGSIGILAQSVGGGGGLGAVAANSDAVTSVSASVKIGGNAGPSANGGKVEVVNRGTITTLGKGAHGIAAQSIGGGGGAVTIDRQDPLNPKVVSNSAIVQEGLTDAYDLLKDLGIMPSGGTQDLSSGILGLPSASLNIGGTGGGGGSGDTVVVRHSGTISTQGQGAFGIFAQSIGGGGGFGADVTEFSPVTLNLNFGGTGGTGGNGGTVFVVLGTGSSITTSGEAASGVFVQSIGGGGGYGGTGIGAKVLGFADPVTEHYGPFGLFTRELGTKGNGGAINIGMEDPLNGTMSITTTGKNAHGIFAQNLGGGGGFVYDLNGKAIPLSSSAAGRSSMEGVGGTVSIMTRGDIMATGEGSYGIWVQNGRQKADGTITAPEAGSGANYIEHTGKLIGGSGSGAAIRIDGGAYTNIVVNAGSEVQAASGVAVVSGVGGQYGIFNRGGLIAGDINVGHAETSNAFVNDAGGTYVSRAGVGQVNLGTYTGDFTNRGILDIGGKNTVSTLNVTAPVTNLAGEMRVDINSLAPRGQQADLLKTQGWVKLDGVSVRPNATQGLLPGSYNLISSRGVVVSQAATVAFNTASPISWSINSPKSGVTDNLSLTPSAKFLKEGDWNNNERAMMNAWQHGWDRSSVAEAPVFAALANIETPEDYRDAVDSMSPDGFQAQSVSQTLAVRTSLNAAHSCPIFADDSVMIEETQCAWARVSGSRTNQYATSAGDGFTQNGLHFRLGAQVEIAKDWFLGTTAGYSNTRFKSGDGYMTSDGHSGDAALALKHQIGPWQFAVSGHVGYGTFDMQQVFDFGETRWTTGADNDMWTAGARFRAAYEFDMTSWYLRPYVDVDALYTYSSGFSTQTYAGVEMDVSALREWTFSISPALEIGTRLDIGTDGWLRPYGSVGATFLHSDGHTSAVSFDSALADGIDFTSTAKLPDTLFDVGLGVQYFVQDKYEIRGEYKAQVADDFLSQEAGIRFSVRF